MTSIPCLAGSLQTLFTTTAETLATASGFVQRRRKLTGSCFAQTLVFGLLDAATATLRQLQLAAGTAGTSVSPQAIAQRCTEEAATFLQQLLAAAVPTLVSGATAAVPLLQRFPAVAVMDSTTIALPPVLRSRWRGCGGSTPTAAAAVLKVQLRLDLCAGGVEVLDLHDGTASDQKARSQTAPLPPGALRLSDQGYFSAAVFRAVLAAGGHFLSRPVPRLTVQVGSANRCSLGTLLAQQGGVIVDLPVRAGKVEPLACRLIAVRVPDTVSEWRRAKERYEAGREARTPRASVLRLASWTIILTSLTQDQLTVAEAVVLLRLRWQVELVFKRWKSAGLQVDTWRTADPWRALCTVYAKLLACLVTHWLAAVSCWEIPAKSLHGAGVATRLRAAALLSALRQGEAQVAQELVLLREIIGPACRLQRRKKRPASFQLLLDPSLQPLN